MTSSTAITPTSASPLLQLPHPPPEASPAWTRQLHEDDASAVTTNIYEYNSHSPRCCSGETVAKCVSGQILVYTMCESGLPLLDHRSLSSTLCSESSTNAASKDNIVVLNDTVESSSSTSLVSSTTTTIPPRTTTTSTSTVNSITAVAASIGSMEDNKRGAFPLDAGPAGFCLVRPVQARFSTSIPGPVLPPSPRATCSSDIADITDSTSLSHSIFFYTAPLPLGQLGSNSSLSHHCPTHPGSSSLDLQTSSSFANESGIPEPCRAALSASSVGYPSQPSASSFSLTTSATPQPQTDSLSTKSSINIPSSVPLSNHKKESSNTGKSWIRLLIRHWKSNSKVSEDAGTGTISDASDHSESVSTENLSFDSFASSRGVDRYRHQERLASCTSLHLPATRKRNIAGRTHFSSIRSNNPTTNSKRGNFLKRMIKVSKNRSIPAPTSDLNQGNTSRPHSSPFLFPILSLNRTASGKSISDDSPPYSSKVGPDPSSALPIWTSATSIASQAAVISHIHRGNFLQLSDDKLDELIRVMAGRNSNVLETIKIHGSAISGADARLLAKLIRSSEAANIRVLNLDRNAINLDAFKYLSEALKTNKTITTLSMVRASVDDRNVKYIAKALSKSTTLKELDLSSNRIMVMGIEALCDAFLYNRTLMRLCLQSNNITKAGASHVARLLTKNRVIRHLNIGSNGLGEEGCIKIADAVRYNRTLTSLSLDMNEMGAAGASAMAVALHSNRHLAYLYIPNNNIGDQGLVDICKSLRKNEGLIGLDLELNQLGSRQSVAGMKALADVLKVNACLRELNLSYNLLSSEAIKVLMEGLSANSTLESILFTNCGIQTEGALTIAEVLPSAKGLQNLGLNFNPDIEVEGYWALATNLAKNRSMKGMQLDYNSGDRHVLYDSIQKSLTTNFIWQQAIYAATCRILILSRTVLLGYPMEQKILQTQQIKEQQQQQQQQQSGGTCDLLKRVDLGGTNSTVSQRSKVALTSSLPNYPAPSNNANEGEGATEIENVAHGSISPRPPSLSGSSIRAGLMQTVGSQQKDQGHLQGLLHHQRQLSNSHSPSIPQLEQILPQEYNAHKVMAQLGNMPYEIFERICAYLDPGHNMTIAQIRAAIQAGGTRSTLTSYYTKARMLEMIFRSRYIPPVGMRYSIKNGDERL